MLAISISPEATTIAVPRSSRRRNVACSFTNVLRQGHAHRHGSPVAITSDIDGLHESPHNDEPAAATVRFAAASPGPLIGDRHDKVAVVEVGVNADGAAIDAIGMFDNIAHRFPCGS